MSKDHAASLGCVCATRLGSTGRISLEAASRRGVSISPMPAFPLRPRSRGPGVLCGLGASFETDLLGGSLAFQQLAVFLSRQQARDRDPNRRRPRDIPLGFPGGSEGKASARYAGDPGSIPGSGRSPGEGNGNPLQYSCLGNPLARGAWRATVHGAQSLTRLSDFFLPPGASAPCPGAAPPPPARRERSGSRRR